MRLFELEQLDPIVAKLIAVTGKLKDDIESGEIAPDWTVEQLLEYLRQHDVTVDVNDLYSMIKKPPLKDIIDNIQGDKVVFKGYGEVEQPQDQQQQIVDKMAHDAMK